MIATDPLSADQWAAIGLADRATFADARHPVIYGQRTADDRLAFGGRGAPYHFRSRIEPHFDTDERVRHGWPTRPAICSPSSPTSTSRITGAARSV